MFIAWAACDCCTGLFAAVLIVFSFEMSSSFESGHYQWWDDNTGKGVDQVLGMRGSSEETGTILATYTGGTKPTAWTWVHTSEQPSDHKEEKRHTLTRSSRDLYIDETNAGNVELLIRVKDQETTTQQPP